MPAVVTRNTAVASENCYWPYDGAGDGSLFGRRVSLMRAGVYEVELSVLASAGAFLPV